MYFYGLKKTATKAAIDCETNVPISCTPKKHPLKNANNATMKGVEPCGMRILKTPQHNIQVMMTRCELNVANKGVAE